MADKSAVTANAKAGGVLRRLARLALAGLAVATAIPAVIVPLYAFVDPPFSTLMLRDRLSGHSYERQWIDLDEVAPVMAHSVVVSEDSLFCMHNGIDWKQMQIAIDQWKAGKEPRGASTIAMQTAKNLFLWPARSYVRKAIELPLAYYMDLVWSKRRMIEIYLNSVEWDNGVYGIQAASRHYFKRSASKLTPRQAALLATALPLPDTRNPARPSRYHARLARLVEERTRDAGPWLKCLEKPA
ncbi:MAG: monofunctional biosynthetic peptidoglycan transglycosylase [Rhodobiaceae bacterium]|nr:monofunctional biosynthetic peptidoglycan transglycosylase [Rhodobiaceae bacterium]MCC0012364.1 monofunctional biosynthetic peptidoglycan transglycosylase [Rhodobiaceae bacterium]